MLARQMSQLDPLPRDLPFRIVSKTIGRGAYASIKKAIPPTASTPVFVVKFIHKPYAIKHGRVNAKQISMEASLHSHIAQHPNIIEWFATGDDAIWKWIAMEYAEGGDLFDKIEADVGVSEDIAHLYFTQLVSGISYMHGKGVGHRDIKPENILLSAGGDLKIADFGLATLFEYQGVRKLSTTMCGSPPYIAPEVMANSRVDRRASKDEAVGYAADLVDIWSCGVVLFVLLVGNTPWDEPSPSSWEYVEYCKTNGRSSDELWSRIPSTALSLLRGMMMVDVTKRFNFSQVKNHPWFTRKNRLLGLDGKILNQIDVATKILEGLRIDFNAQPTASQRLRESQDAMDLDQSSEKGFMSSTQPETPINDIVFDWERPPRIHAAGISSSQPTYLHDAALCNMTNGRGGPSVMARAMDPLLDEPSMSQFSSVPGVPISLTQHARKFRDIVPSYSLTRFFSHLTRSSLIGMLSHALHALNVPLPGQAFGSDNPLARGGDHAAGPGSAYGPTYIKIKTLDGRRCPLNGDIIVDSLNLDGMHESGDPSLDLLEVRFVKAKGDPLEWRRFFKAIVVLCKDGVYVPDNR